MSKTPTCPSCKAKFAHDQQLKVCKKCGLPDEVRDEGPKAIARWKRNPWSVECAGSTGVLVKVGMDTWREVRDTSKAERRRERKRREHPATASKRRNKHGRRGVTHGR